MEKISLESPKTGSDLVLETLRDLGVDTIFGYPGGAVLPFYDAIYNFKGIRHILGRHEQGCLHEAEGYAKSTGKLGVAVVTSGPGATNAITGIADAMSDSVPLLVFTGQVARAGIGKDAFQEADIVGITMPITKYNYQVRETADIPRIITEAVHIATTGRPGPVVIDLPKDISALETDFIYSPEVNLPSYQPTLEPNDMQIKKILKQLSKAKKPVLLAGGGISYAEAATELNEFAERYQIPVVTSLLGQGTIATSHPLFLGMGGMHGSFAANIAMTEADFMISIGSRFDDRLTGNPKTFAKNAKVAHIDIDPAEIGKIISADIPVVGDAKKALQMLLAEPTVHNNTEKWIEKVTKDKNRVRSYDKKERVVQPQAVIERIGELTNGDAIVVTDVGQHQMWTAQYYPYQNERQLVTSGGLGTMGFGIPAAIGAKIANPDKEVVLFVGDGGFQMTNQELAILNIYKVPIKVVMLNNHSLGMVRQWQESFYEGRTSESVFDTLPDFQLMAQAYGIKNYKFDNPETLAQDLEVITEDVPMLIEVDISRKEQVLPMVPAGKSNHEMLGGSSMRRMLTAKLQNRSGVLNRFTGVLSRRQVNIESISVGATEDPNVSRITIIIDVASHDEVEQIIKQLNRQIDVIRIRDITDKPHLEREVILVKMSAPAEKRAEILAIIQPFRATVVDVAPSSITIQMTGNAEKSEALLRVIRPYGIRNIARTGATGFTRD
ncbi:acetolactate synthase large subunit [Streptococcus pneumoniae]|nr:acetolactate synthase large subunit [Streptococcus pneumoniae]SNE43344.1 acetolactate synthase large subunit [Streptococcus pneumoniae]